MRRMVETLVISFSFLLIAGCATNPTFARVEKLEKAAESGDPKAQFDLASEYLRGISEKGQTVLKKDIGKALALFEKSANGGYQEAAAILGYYYWAPLHVARDNSAALKWFTAAETKHSFFLIGQLYQFDKKIGIDYGKAYGNYIKAGDLGFLPGYDYAASLIRDGLIPGKSKDDVLALYEKCVSGKWFAETFFGSQNWELKSLQSLIDMFYAGKYVDKDLDKAARLLGAVGFRFQIAEFDRMVDDMAKQGCPAGAMVYAKKYINSAVNDLSIFARQGNYAWVQSAGKSSATALKYYTQAMEMLLKEVTLRRTKKNVDSLTFFCADMEMAALGFKANGIERLEVNRYSRELLDSYMKLTAAQQEVIRVVEHVQKDSVQ